MAEEKSHVLKESCPYCGFSLIAVAPHAVGLNWWAYWHLQCASCGFESPFHIPETGQMAHTTEDAIRIARLPEKAVAPQLLEACQANHEWHKRYDETDSYPGSELCLINEAAIRAALGEEG